MTLEGINKENIFSRSIWIYILLHYFTEVQRADYLLLLKLLQIFNYPGIINERSSVQQESFSKRQIMFL